MFSHAICHLVCEVSGNDIIVFHSMSCGLLRYRENEELTCSVLLRLEFAYLLGWGVTVIQHLLTHKRSCRISAIYSVSCKGGTIQISCFVLASLHSSAS